MPGKESDLWENYRWGQMKYGNFIQDLHLHILNNLSFSVYTISLHVIAIIIWRRYLEESGVWEKLKSQAWVFKRNTNFSQFSS